MQPVLQPAVQRVGKPIVYSPSVYTIHPIVINRLSNRLETFSETSHDAIGVPIGCQTVNRV